MPDSLSWDGHLNFFAYFFFNIKVNVCCNAAAISVRPVPLELRGSLFRRSSDSASCFHVPT